VSTRGHRPPKDKSRIVFLERGLSEVGSLALERRYIAWYGRRDLKTGILYNQTDGGEGTSNKSKETRQKMSISNQGRVVSKGTRLKQSRAKQGIKHSVEFAEKRAAAHRGIRGRVIFVIAVRGVVILTPLL